MRRTKAAFDQMLGVARDAGGEVTEAGVRRIRTIGGMVLVGSVLMAAAMVAAYWSAKPF